NERRRDRHPLADRFRSEWMPQPAYNEEPRRPAVSAGRRGSGFERTQPMYASRSFSSANLGLAPMIVVSTWPLLKTFIAGIDVIWYFMARSGFSSTFSFRMVILPGCSA